MEYIKINGFNGGTLYYLPEEKHLFLQKSTRDGIIYLVCYDTIVNKPKISEGVSVRVCRARRRINESTKECSKTSSDHCVHGNHEILFRDLVSLNKMKEQCRFLSEKFPFSAHLVPISEIFIIEMAK